MVKSLQLSGMIPIVVVRHRLCVDLWMCPLLLLAILVSPTSKLTNQQIKAKTAATSHSAEAGDETKQALAAAADGRAGDRAVQQSTVTVRLTVHWGSGEGR